MSPVGHGRADLFGHMQGGPQDAFLVAGGNRGVLAGEGHEHLVVAVGAADAGEALVQVAALEEGPHERAGRPGQKPYLAANRSS